MTTSLMVRDDNTAVGSDDNKELGLTRNLETPLAI